MTAANEINFAPYIKKSTPNELSNYKTFTAFHQNNTHKYAMKKWSF